MATHILYEGVRLVVLPNYWKRKVYMDKIGAPVEPMPGSPPSKKRNKSPPPTIISPPGSGKKPMPPSYHLESFGSTTRKPMLKEGVPVETRGTTGNTQNNESQPANASGGQQMHSTPTGATGSNSSTQTNAGGSGGSEGEQDYVVVHGVAVPQTLDLPTQYIFRPIPSSFKWGGYLIAYDPRTYRVQIIKNGQVIAQYKYDPATRKFVIDETWLFFAKKEDVAEENRDVADLEREVFTAPESPASPPMGEYYEKKHRQEMLDYETMMFKKPDYGTISYEVEEVPIDVGFYAVDRQRKYEAWLELEKIARKYGFNFSPVPFAYEEPLLDVGLYAVGREHAYNEWERKRKRPFKDSDYWGLGKVLNWLEEKVVSAEDWLDTHAGNVIHYLELPAKGVAVLADKMKKSSIVRYGSLLTPFGQSIFTGNLIMESAIFRPSSLGEVKEIMKESYEAASDFSIGASVGMLGAIASIQNPKAWLSIFKPTTYEAMYEEVQTGGFYGLGELTGSLALMAIGLKGVKVPRKVGLDIASLKEFNMIYKNFELGEEARIIKTKDWSMVTNPELELSSMDYLAKLSGKGELLLKPSKEGGLSIKPGEVIKRSWFEWRDNYLFRHNLEVFLEQKNEPWWKFWKRLKPGEKYRLKIKYYGDYGFLPKLEFFEEGRWRGRPSRLVTDFAFKPEKFFRLGEELEFEIGPLKKTKILAKRKTRVKAGVKMKARDPVEVASESVEKILNEVGDLVFKEEFMPSVSMPISTRVPVPLGFQPESESWWNPKPNQRNKPFSKFMWRSREKTRRKRRGREKMRLSEKERLLDRMIPSMKDKTLEKEATYDTFFDMVGQFAIDKTIQRQLLKIPSLGGFGRPERTPPDNTPPNVDITLTFPFGFFPDVGKWRRPRMRSRRKKVKKWEIIYPERMIALLGVMV